MYRGVVLLYSPRDNLPSVLSFGYNSIQRPVIVVSISLHCFYSTFLVCFPDLPCLPCDKLALSPEKCEWHMSEVNFLGYIISENVIEMDQEKIRTLLEWKELTTVKKVKSFLGFANFYRHFIQGYSKLTRYLTDLTKKSEKSEWQAEYQKAFDMLKKRFTSAPILRHFDPELQCVIECDACDFANGAILSQEVEGHLHPVVFHSMTLNKHEINYEIHDKE